MSITVAMSIFIKWVLVNKIVYWKGLA